MPRDILAVFLLLVLLLIGGFATVFSIKKVFDSCVTSVTFQQDGFNQ